jgi:hypothetical protein
MTSATERLLRSSFRPALTLAAGIVLMLAVAVSPGLGARGPSSAERRALVRAARVYMRDALGARLERHVHYTRVLVSTKGPWARLWAEGAGTYGNRIQATWLLFNRADGRWFYAGDVQYIGGCPPTAVLHDLRLGPCTTPDSPTARAASLLGAMRRAEGAASSYPPGYRRATSSERRAMDRAVDRGAWRGLRRRFAWRIGLTDPSYGFVCGYERGGVWGAGVRNTRGRWRSGVTASREVQLYAQFCTRLARRAAK